MDEKRTVSLQDYKEETSRIPLEAGRGEERRARRGAAPELARGPKSRGTANRVTMPLSRDAP
ncbi:hypothetical protein KUU49_35170, partial [Pseudomonas aeruginosa]|nr:hypothetical protein [Pseudomonas aeruginosa]